jgi:hypothetical protein
MKNSLGSGFLAIRQKMQLYPAWPVSLQQQITGQISLLPGGL